MLVWPLLLALLGLGRAGAADPVLHERVEFGPGGASAVASGPSAAPAAPSAGGPSVLAPAGGGERAVFDPRTTGDDDLTYEAVFEPSVAPFKRVVALDLVAPDGSLGLADGGLVPVPVVGGATEPGREAFEGTLAVRVEPGRWTRLPTVAAGARLLDAAASPPVALRFGRDSAEGLYATADEPELVTLVLRMDARQDYFGAPLPAGARLSDVPEALRPRLAAGLRARAERVLEAARIRPGEDGVAVLLTSLAGWFRGFAPGHVPPARFRDDPYLAIALSRTGVCRHRAHAFVITAQAVGLPARYVHNEAHAFAEVFVPGRGWMRVDLGGASRSLEVVGSDGRRLHRPAFADPFPRPQGFVRSGLAVLRATGYEADAVEAPAGGEPAAPGTTVSVTPGRARVRRGGAVEVSGEVRAADGRPVPVGDVIVALYGPGLREPVLVLPVAQPDANGRFSVRLDVTRGLSPGVYEVIAAYSDPGGEHPPAVSDPRLLGAAPSP